MDILFINKRLAKAFSSHKKLIREYGAKRAKRIEQRMKELQAADTLADMRYFPGKCHELREDRAGQLAVSLDGSYRLVFEPNHNPPPTRPGGGLDWSHVTEICILEVVNYHGN